MLLFELVKFFGDVPLFTSRLTAGGWYSNKGAKKEVYAQIELDLQNAIGSL